MTRIRQLLLASVLAAMGCNEPFAARAERIVTVMEYETACMGTLWTTCLQVRWDDSRTVQNFYGTIEGFEFRDGVRQRLRVEQLRLNNPPSDGSAYEYRLLEVLDRKAIPGPTLLSATSPR